MIIIRKGKKTTKKAFVFNSFPLSKDVNYEYLKGFAEEEDLDPKEFKKLKKVPPMRRPARFEQEPPPIVRWMWNPQTGEMLVDAGRGVQHALMLDRYKRDTGKGKEHYSFWLRGFYFPKTNEVAIRPFESSALYPERAIRTDADRWEAEQEGKAFSDKMQQHFKSLLERELGKKLKFHYNVDNPYMAQTFKDIGGERW